MTKLRIRRPADPKTVIVLIPRLILFFLIMAPLTSLFFLIPLVVIAASLLIGLFIPIALCQPISQIASKNCRIFASMMFVLFYPLLSGLTMLFLLVLVLMYPLLRNKNHHGAYDPFDNGLSLIAVYYLKFAVWLLYCCAS